MRVSVSQQIRVLKDDPAVVGMLGEMLVAVVAAGGSVGFMHPLAVAAAEEFWRNALYAATRGQRVVLGAWQDERLVGTISVLLDLPPNQPHRAELAKLMVHPDFRGQGLAGALVSAAEHQALCHQRTLLVLDTASEDGAARIYERLGYSLTGEIPGFALKPHGGLTGTLIYFKRLELRAD